MNTTNTTKNNSKSEDVSILYTCLIIFIFGSMMLAFLHTMIFKDTNIFSDIYNYFKKLLSYKSPYVIEEEESSDEEEIQLPVTIKQIKTFSNINNYSIFCSICQEKQKNTIKIDCPPYGATQVLEIDPVTYPNNPTTRLIGQVMTADSKYMTGILANNGKIYCAPFDTTATQVLEIDPTPFGNPNNPTTRLIGQVMTGDSKYMTGVLANNGKIYCPPYGFASALYTNQVLEIDPETEKTKLIGQVMTGSYKYDSAVLANNGKIYCPPHGSDTTRVLEIDPDKGTRLIGQVISGGSYKYTTAVLAKNGKIYAPPFSNTEQVLQINVPLEAQQNYQLGLILGLIFGLIVGISVLVYLATKF